MRKKHVVAIIAVLLLLSIVATAYGVTWTKVRTWANQHVEANRFGCHSLPYYGGYNYHRVSLKPLTVDHDLWVWGFNGSSWVLIDLSNNSGLVNDKVQFSGTIRSSYNTIMACSRGYSGAGHYHLYYFVGN